MTWQRRRLKRWLECPGTPPSYFPGPHILWNPGSRACPRRRTVSPPATGPGSMASKCATRGTSLLSSALTIPPFQNFDLQVSKPNAAHVKKWQSEKKKCEQQRIRGGRMAAMKICGVPRACDDAIITIWQLFLLLLGIKQLSPQVIWVRWKYMLKCMWLFICIHFFTVMSCVDPYVDVCIIFQERLYKKMDE